MVWVVCGEGVALRVVTPGGEFATPGGYGAEGHVHQEFLPLPDFDCQAEPAPPACREISVFERFDDRARCAVVAAQDEARRLGQAEIDSQAAIDSDHLLPGVFAAERARPRASCWTTAWTPGGHAAGSLRRGSSTPSSA
ncbi:hypothetical protein HNP84_005703 [Thermocatellispora tengchongensis]|uniref:Uncharacterized protein n=1 Tax=Thermocatellispora tengchongensis TaxID=1073253 RepID=A0A840PAC8_9ACTN|nr:hypothetical protein [Thermocatellispora tengchongensis]MBB5135959.1 hypothetical protein [Thermocatellispora tengchongensis]